MKLSAKDCADHLTKKELAKKWDCRVRDIDHCIYDAQSLRLAAKVSESSIVGLYRLSDSTFNLADGLLNIFSSVRESESCSDVRSAQYPPLRNVPIPEAEVFFPRFEGDPIQVGEDQLLKDEYLPRYLYRHIFKGSRAYMAQDFEENHYYLLSERCEFNRTTREYFNPQFLCLDDSYFKYITTEEVERFELEYGIDSGTKNVIDTIAKKTENTYLEIIDTFTKALLGNDYSEKPHSNASRIDRLLSRKDLKLPCTLETLAKYLTKKL